jgi:hypothetical protein
MSNKNQQTNKNLYKQLINELGFELVSAQQPFFKEN